MALLPGYKANFDTLLQAARAEDLALLECREITTGTSVPVICAANRLPDGRIDFVPLATLFNENPYERVVPPGGHDLPQSPTENFDDVRPDGG